MRSWLLNDKIRDNSAVGNAPGFRISCPEGDAGWNSTRLTIRVINRPCLRRDTLQFVTPTPTHNDRQSYTPRNYIRKVPINSTFYIQGTAGVHISNSEAMVSAPASLHYSYHPDDHGRYNVIKIATKWSPNICDQKGPQQLCVWGIDNFGVTTNPRCMAFIIGDDNDYCSLGSAACDNNGKCINVYKEPAERCDCLPGYTSYNCDVVTKCNPNPCRNGTCYEIPPNNFYCLCNVGYKGTTCNYKIPPCNQDPCQNSGICFNVIDNVENPDFRCHCTQGFTGQKCQDLITTHVTTLPKTSISTYLWTLATSKMTAPNKIAMSTPPFTTSRKTTKTPVTSPTTSSSTTTTTASTSTITTSPMPSTTTTTVPTSPSSTVKTTLATTRSTTPPTTTPSTTSSTTTKTTTQSTTTTTYPTSTTTATLPTTRKPSTAKPSTRSTTATMITTRHVAVATSRRVTTNTPSTVATKMSTQNVFTTSHALFRNITPVCRPNRILNRSQAKSNDKTMFIMYISIGGVAALSMLVLVSCIIIGCNKRSKNLVKPFNDSETSKGKKKRN